MTPSETSAGAARSATADRRPAAASGTLQASRPLSAGPTHAPGLHAGSPALLVLEAARFDAIRRARAFQAAFA